MSMLVVTVAAGGLPIVQLAAVGGLPVTEAANGRGLAVTKVTARGLPATFVDASGAVVPPFTATAWNPADLASIALTNNNLTATGTATTGCGVRAIKGISSAGKYYLEYKISFIQTNGMAVGIGLASAVLPGAVITNRAIVSRLGTITINGSQQGSAGMLGPRAVNDVFGVAVDIGAALVWFRVAPAGNWNAGGGADPAAGVGGYSIAVLSGALFPLFQTGSGGAGDAVIANFGASAFSGAVPAGFTAGWG